MPRPALPDHQIHPGLQADPQFGRVLARQPGQRQPLQRIYGTAWESQEALDRHLELIEEAQRRDHRKLGVELDLFSFPDELGSGLPVFHPKGGIVRRELEEYSRQKHIQAGYEFVNTPHHQGTALHHLGPPGVVRRRHVPADAHRRRIRRERRAAQTRQDYYLKPMNCPMHHLIFRSRGRSYRELPLRLFEFGTVYRYEKSGVIHGLTRVRYDPGRLAHLLHP